MNRFIAIIICVIALTQCGQRQNPDTPSEKIIGKSSGNSCAPTLVGAYLTDKAAPFFTGLDYFNFPITTDSSPISGLCDASTACIYK